jgi:penicillin-binding protein 2
MGRRKIAAAIVALLLQLCFLQGSFAAAHTRAHTHAMIRSVSRSRLHYARRASIGYRNSRAAVVHTPGHYIADPFADPSLGDLTQNDDPMVRDAAVKALGHLNGSVLAVDPSNGRILTIVNQKMALSPGYEPCSTIKPVIAVAALQKGLIGPQSMLPVGGRQYMDLTEALAHSNNSFFEQLGTRLGFDTVHDYAQEFGFGERAALDMPGEMPGSVAAEPPARGGVARMSSFGSGIRITPLQLVSMAAAVANGGTLYYLQYAHSGAKFSPRVKRELDIASLLPDLREGMLAAVLYGTAKTSFDPEGEQSLGKTGTCNDETQGGRLGWFVSYADQVNPHFAMVVLLRGNSRAVSGPRAAGIAGLVYRSLHEQNYFHDDEPAVIFTPAPGI